MFKLILGCAAHRDAPGRFVKECIHSPANATDQPRFANNRAHGNVCGSKTSHI